MKGVILQKLNVVPFNCSIWLAFICFLGYSCSCRWFTVCLFDDWQAAKLCSSNLSYSLASIHGLHSWSVFQQGQHSIKEDTHTLEINSFPRTPFVQRFFCHLPIVSKLMFFCITLDTVKWLLLLVRVSNLSLFIIHVTTLHREDNWMIWILFFRLLILCRHLWCCRWGVRFGASFFMFT